MEGEIDKSTEPARFFCEALTSNNVKLCFMGCVDSTKRSTARTIETLQDTYRNVFKMRRNLLELIFSAENQVMLTELPIAAERIREIEQVEDDQIKCCGEICSATDYDMGTFWTAINGYAKNHEVLQKHIEIIQNTLLLYEKHQLHSLPIKTKLISLPQQTKDRLPNVLQVFLSRK